MNLDFVGNTYDRISDLVHSDQWSGVTNDKISTPIVLLQQLRFKKGC